jgi:hypothetical protein
VYIFRFRIDLISNLVGSALANGIRAESRSDIEMGDLNGINGYN